VSYGAMFLWPDVLPANNPESELNCCHIDSLIM